MSYLALAAFLIGGLALVGVMFLTVYVLDERDRRRTMNDAWLARHGAKPRQEGGA